MYFHLDISRHHIRLPAYVFSSDITCRMKWMDANLVKSIAAFGEMRGKKGISGERTTYFHPFKNKIVLQFEESEYFPCNPHYFSFKESIRYCILSLSYCCDLIQRLSQIFPLSTTCSCSIPHRREGTFVSPLLNWFVQYWFK